MSLVWNIFLILMIISFVFNLDYQSGFGTTYENKNYIPLIIESHPFSITEVSSHIDCSYTCLQQYDCSLAVFSKNNQQCKIYNLLPLVEQELLPNSNTIVFIFERTIQLPQSISNIDWLLTRLNTTIPFRKNTTERARCLSIDVFGYLLTLDSWSSTNYLTRYNRTTLEIIQRISFPDYAGDAGMFTYYNKMLFISYVNQSYVHVYDHINLNLITTITCGAYLYWPRDIIFIESQNLMIMTSAKVNYVLFFRVNSLSNYTCINQISLIDHPHGITKVSETFFYVTTWNSRSIFSFQYNGNSWSSSLFVNISYAVPNTGSTDVAPAHLRIDHLGRRWVVLFNYGLIVYNDQGTLLGKWRIPMVIFDIIITNDYRFIMSNRVDSSLTIYDPRITK